jgi:pyruvate/2-oxoglutarate/acetoin dehydrogenase E1 component
MTTFLESINQALIQALTNDEKVILMGEDILDPYGGAFKVTRGLSEAFPDRVLTTPISEAAIVGLGSGMALRGLRPVVEIMFGDFITLIADQIINHAAKFNWMYNKQAEVPIVIRTPMGGRRGYGPTHSQTLEKIFLGTPGLRILAPCPIGDPGKLLLDAIFEDNHPTLFIENKLLYLTQINSDDALKEFAVQENNHPISSDLYAPTYSLKIKGAPVPDLTIAAYGYMAELARQAALKLAYHHEIFVELVIPTQLSPFNDLSIIHSSERSRKLLVIEEGNLSMGWGAEIAARTAESLGPKLKRIHRLAARDLPIAASGPLEASILPDVDNIIQAAQLMV